MTNLKRLENKLVAKGIRNTEVTKKGKTYYVLHICPNGVPIAIFTTEDKAELLQYLDVHYEIGIQEELTK